MPTTPTYVLPYPAAGDPADVPVDMQELADRIETVRGATNGLASLDSGGKVPAAQLPAALPGAELAYAQITASVSITATSAATAQAVINPGNVSYDGSVVLVEFFAVSVVTPTVAGATILLNLWETNTDLGILAQIATPAASAASTVVRAARRLTPAAGNRNYNIRGWISPSGSGQVAAGNGGAAQLPAFLRVTRV